MFAALHTAHSLDVVGQSTKSEMNNNDSSKLVIFVGNKTGVIIQKYLITSHLYINKIKIQLVSNN